MPKTTPHASRSCNPLLVMWAVYGIVAAGTWSYFLIEHFFPESHSPEPASGCDLSFPTYQTYSVNDFAYYFTLTLNLYYLKTAVLNSSSLLFAMVNDVCSSLIHVDTDPDHSDSSCWQRRLAFTMEDGGIGATVSTTLGETADEFLFDRNATRFFSHHGSHTDPKTNITHTYTNPFECIAEVLNYGLETPPPPPTLLEKHWPILVGATAASLGLLLTITACNRACKRRSVNNDSSSDQDDAHLLEEYGASAASPV